MQPPVDHLRRRSHGIRRYPESRALKLRWHHSPPAAARRFDQKLDSAAQNARAKAMVLRVQAAAPPRQR